MDGSGIIYLMRHCATSNNDQNYPILMGQRMATGICLSDRGVAQANALAEYFEGKGIDAIYASPLGRAVQTARIVNTSVDGPVTFCTSLVEADMGSWEGLSWDRIMREDDENYGAFLADPGTYGFPDGENLSQICRRALAFIEKLAIKHPDQRVVVISHRCVNRAVLAHLMALPMHRAREIDEDPGCVNVIRVFRGVMELQTVNYTGSFEPTEEEEEQCDSPSTTSVT